MTFGSVRELARFLWNDPGQDPRNALAYPHLVKAKEAWLRQGEPDGEQRLAQSLSALDTHYRQVYFCPPADPVTVGGVRRQVVVLAYHIGEGEHAVWWAPVTMDPMDDKRTITWLKEQIDLGYGEGFFNQHIRDVRRLGESLLKKPPQDDEGVVTFGAPEGAPEDPTSCDVSREVV